MLKMLNLGGKRGLKNIKKIRNKKMEIDYQNILLGVFTASHLKKISRLEKKKFGNSLKM